MQTMSAQIRRRSSAFQTIHFMKHHNSSSRVFYQVSEKQGKHKINYINKTRQTHVKGTGYTW